MKLPTLSFLLCLLLLGGFGLQVQAQGARIVDLEGTTRLDIQMDEAPPVDFGEIKPGTMVRKKMVFENTYEQPIKLVRIISEAGCFTSGTTNNLREVKLEVGQECEFYLMTTAQKPGAYDIRNEIIIEMEGQRYRRAVFQFKGFVSDAATND